MAAEFIQNFYQNFDRKSNGFTYSRTTKITLDGILKREKLQSCLKLRNFLNPFNKDKSVGL